MITSPGQASLAVLDLRDESKAYSEQVRSVRVMYAFLSALFIGVLVLFASAAVTYGIAGFLWVVFPVVFLCLSVLLGESFLLLWKLQPGAIGVVIRDHGVEFTWLSGRVDFLPWSAVSRELVLRDFSGSGWNTPGSANNWYVRRWNRPSTRLSKTAFDAIIQFAAGKGLGVREQYHRPTPFSWAPYRIVRFAVSAEPAQ